MDEFQWDFGQPERLISWDDENLRKVGMDFLRLVLVNMQDQRSVVKFDKQHNHYRPNYQIKFANGLHQWFDGISHAPLQTLNAADLTRLSDAFELSKVRAVYEQLYAEFKH